MFCTTLFAPFVSLVIMHYWKDLFRPKLSFLTLSITASELEIVMYWRIEHRIVSTTDLPRDRQWRFVTTGIFLSPKHWWHVTNKQVHHNSLPFRRESYFVWNSGRYGDIWMLVIYAEFSQFTFHYRERTDESYWIVQSNWTWT